MPVDFSKLIGELSRRGIQVQAPPENAPAAPPPDVTPVLTDAQAEGASSRALQRTLRNKQLAGQIGIQDITNELARRGVKTQLATEPDVSAAAKSEARLKAIDQDLLARSHSANPKERQSALREISRRATELEYAQQFGEEPPNQIEGEPGGAPVDVPPFEEWVNQQNKEKLDTPGFFSADPNQDAQLRAQYIDRQLRDPQVRQDYEDYKDEAANRAPLFQRGSDEYYRQLRSAVEGKQFSGAVKGAKIKALPGILEAEAKAKLEGPAKQREEVNKLNTMAQGSKTLSDFRTQAAAVNTVVNLGTKPNPTNADDLSLIYAYVKLLDPGSVVREGEIRLARSATPLLGQLTLAYNRLYNTRNALLDPPTRKTYLNSALSLAKSVTDNARPEYQRIAGIAEERGVPLNKIFTAKELNIIGGKGLLEGTPSAEGAAPAAAPAASPAAPAAGATPTTKTVIQNGYRYQRQPDGSYIPVGPA